MITEAKLFKLMAETAHLSTLDGLPADYGNKFAEPLPDGKCLCCGVRGAFTWGLTHGEGYCHYCGWPARLYHFIKDHTGNEQRIVRLLQYHPDQIVLAKTKNQLMETEQ